MGARIKVGAVTFKWMIRWLKQLVTGLSIPQEYVCLCADDLDKPFSVVLVDEQGNDCGDVTTSHVFLGYKPLVIGLLAAPELLNGSTVKLSLRFKQGQNQSEVAVITLRKLAVKANDNLTLVFYEGVTAAHKFISPWHQRVNRYLSKYEPKPVNNVALNDSLYDQVRIAYAIPREIRLITVSDGIRVNTFPTDLHGHAGDGFYVSSLRKDGLACSQVAEYKRILLSEMDVSNHKEVYAMGKNHMREMQKAHTDAETKFSRVFNFPLPVGAGRYVELETVDHHEIGIHRLFIYRIINFETLVAVKPLAHLHRFAVQWRLNNGLATDYKIR